MKLTRLFHMRKHRKYPIKRDEQGLSLRQRCFQMFEEGKRPIEVAQELKVDVATVCRYYRDWKKVGPNFETFYKYVKSLFNKESPDREENLKIFARAWGIDKERLEIILAQPHGLKRLLTRSLYMPAHADLDHKRSIAFRLALLISDHLINKGKYSDVYFALRRYMQENKRYREKKDADIEKNNETMKLFHRALAKEMANEREGRIRPDTYTEEEQNFAIKWSMDKEKKEMELTYWFRIGKYMAQGLSKEEAREKVLKDEIDKGDPIKSEVFRKFQNEIHPLKTNDQASPPSPPQTPSPT
jgi:hypothetical protein